MESERFEAVEFGRATRKGASFWYFEPEPIPRRLQLSEETIMALSAADTALGRLSSAGKYLRDPAVFVRPYVTREAVASSRIEGTEASMSDVFQAQAGGDDRPRRSEVQEVQRYIAALDYGLVRLQELPISIRLVRELHRVLMRGVRGRDKRPGDLRESPVYIGSTTDSPETAVFIPPLAPVAQQPLEGLGAVRAARRRGFRCSSNALCSTISSRRSTRSWMATGA